MKLEKQVFELTDDEIKNHMFITNAETDYVKFYDYIREKLNISNDDILDCTKISIAANIFDVWQQDAKDQNYDNDLNTMMLIYGPKIDEDLSDNQVLICNGFASKDKSIVSDEKLIPDNGKFDTIYLNGKEYILGPLNEDQLKDLLLYNNQRGNYGNYVSAVIACNLDDIIDRNFEEFLNFISIEMFGNDLLMDIDYNVVGICGDCKQTIYLLVSGDVSTIIE